MHELSLCRAIAASVTTHAEGRRVARVRVVVGHFRQVVPETLEHCWELQTSGTDLEGSVLDVTHVPATVRCRACGADTELAVPVFRCHACDGTDVELVRGDELLIESIDVEAEPAARSAG